MEWMQMYVRSNKHKTPQDIHACCVVTNMLRDKHKTRTLNDRRDRKHEFSLTFLFFVFSSFQTDFFLSRHCLSHTGDI